MESADQIKQAINAVGITLYDAEVIADCILTRKSCSWVNTDPVDEKIMAELDSVIRSHNYGIKVVVSPVATRSKYIWEVKVLAK